MSRYGDAAELLAWERKIQAAAAQTYLEWAKELEGLVLPSVATLGGQTSAVLPTVWTWEPEARAAWTAAVKAGITPEIETQMLARVDAKLAGYPVPEGTILGEPLTARITDGRTSAAASAVYRYPAMRERQAAYLEAVTNRLVGSPEPVFRVLSKEVGLGLAKGEGAVGLAARVQSVLARKGSADWFGRATTIARTEATGAFNGATWEAAELRSQVFGIEMEKIWLATVDGRTRDTHFAADGQRRKLDALFSVGAAELKWPGDPAGPASEVVNCRCTMLEVEEGEPGPGETDRQTERGPGNATVRNREGSQNDEVNRRAADGVVRAREDPDGDGFVAASERKASGMGTKWTGMLLPLGVPTADDRIMAADAEVIIRELPLPLMWQKQSGNGHDQSYTVGAIQTAEMVNGELQASGVMFDTPEAMEATEQAREKVTKPSIDYVDEVWAIVGEDGEALSDEQIEDAMFGESDTKILMQSSKLTVLGATLVSIPAFQETYLTLEDDEVEVDPDLADALVASGVQTHVYGAELFNDPGFGKVTPLSVDKETGRVSGHIASWGTCHLGIQDACVTPPHSETGYALFHVSEVETDEGPLGVGRLTVGGGHASARSGVQAATDHYDDVCSSWAMVRAGEDEYGIWVSGVVDPSADTKALAQGMSAPVSGDWRRHGGNLEMVAALGVVAPGFPVPRGTRDSAGRDTALVAAGAVLKRRRGGQDDVVGVAEAAAIQAVERYARREHVLASVGRRADQIRAGDRMAEQVRTRFLEIETAAFAARLDGM